MKKYLSNQTLDLVTQALEKNIIATQKGDWLVAGAHQFRTFWVRDFCFSVPGLLLLGKHHVVQNQLTHLLQNIGPDDLLPRGFDVVNPKLRVLCEVFGIPARKMWSYEKRKINPEQLGEHGTPAADSNVLTLLQVLNYVESTDDREFIERNLAELKKVYLGIKKLKVGDFLSQPPYSDWQDSASRHGTTFYLNLMCLILDQRLADLGLPLSQTTRNLEHEKKKIFDYFYDSHHGLFRSQPERAQYSLETQLWCIEKNVFKNWISSEQLWLNLKSSPLWSELPGIPVWPSYAAHEVSVTTKFVGLKRYHDGFHWSWLLGESLKIAKIMNDEQECLKISAAIEKTVLKHRTVHEIYEKTRKTSDSALTPVRRAFYTSESPFSWGAAKIIEAELTPYKQI